MGEAVIHQQLCAAFSNGCTSRLIWRGPVHDDGRDRLELNGWRLDHGRWVCSNHPAAAPEHARSTQEDSE